MSEIRELQHDEQTFLEPFLPQNACNTSLDETRTVNTQPSQPPTHPASEDDDLPFVTLTYACSLDSMIALAPGSRTTLSGPETKSMTHFLRLKHDAILIGAGTAAVDDPALNCRYPGATLDDQPRPVIVDPNGRWTKHATKNEKKASRLAREGLGKTPWAISREQRTKLDSLLQIGCESVCMEPKTGPPSIDMPANPLPVAYQCVYVDTKNGFSDTEMKPNIRIPWPEILKSLKRKGINSVMIEGGANVINTLLGMPELVDSLIITIAPTFLGQGGVVVGPDIKLTSNNERTNALWLHDSTFRQFGSDVVLCGRLDDMKLQATSEESRNQT